MFLSILVIVFANDTKLSLNKELQTGKKMTNEIQCNCQVIYTWAKRSHFTYTLMGSKFADLRVNCKGSLGIVMDSSIKMTHQPLQTPCPVVRDDGRWKLHLQNVSCLERNRVWISLLHALHMTFPEAYV
ncbi:Hypothetical predicted protein [Podarcis lilfordi]|uniref:Uncharacterized protein n=1 Tax=Podarcis lilfordi TaxID=74358 RepID=A0AA35P4U2_9SAUR|nr:Hypothetical predicted protein [Podarcis lilfordi]